MIAVDTNLLVYAHREDAVFHDVALGVLLELAGGRSRWAIPWPCVHEFVAIVTHPRIYDPPSPLGLALDAIGVWLRSPGCETLGEGVGYFDTLARVARTGAVVGPKIHDARIAALCLHHGVREFWTADRDFSRFADLAVRNPLVGRPD